MPRFASYWLRPWYIVFFFKVISGVRYQTFYKSLAILVSYEGKSGYQWYPTVPHPHLSMRAATFEIFSFKSSLLSGFGLSLQNRYSLNHCNLNTFWSKIFLFSLWTIEGWLKNWIEQIFVRALVFLQRAFQNPLMLSTHNPLDKSK